MSRGGNGFSAFGDWDGTPLRYEPQETLSLGCVPCADRTLCGGQRISGPSFSCLDFCCGQPKSCAHVCTRNPELFVACKREVDGFDLGNVPSAPRLRHRALPRSVPLIQHGRSRRDAVQIPVVALPLFGIVQASTGQVRFRSKEELCSHFKVPASAYVIASGVAFDAPIERWWRLPQREKTIESLQFAGVDVITTPNFSLASHVPRWDNFYGMKRIALACSQFQIAGLPAALHVNGAHGRDYERWTHFIAERPEIDIISVEFGTGAAGKLRKLRHVEWLCEMANKIGRPLTLIVRGARDQLPALRGSFSRVLFLDTESFVKAHKRKRAELSRNGRLLWRSAGTLPGMPIDDLLVHNVKAVHRYVGAFSRLVEGEASAAVIRSSKARSGHEKPPKGRAFSEIKLPDGW